MTSSSDPGERQAHELADRIRTLATTDPDLAQDLVDELIAALDRATEGAFRGHLGGAGSALPTVAELGGLTGSSSRNS